MKPTYREKNLLDYLFGGFRSTLKSGPEPLEKEIHKILGSKHEDQFSDPFLKLVQKIQVHFFVPASLL